MNKKKKTEHTLVNCWKCKKQVTIKILNRFNMPVNGQEMVTGMCPNCNIKLSTKELQEKLI